MRYEQWKARVESLLRLEFGVSFYRDCEESFRQAYQLGRSAEQVIEVLQETLWEIRRIRSLLN